MTADVTAAVRGTAKCNGHPFPEAPTGPAVHSWKHAQRSKEPDEGPQRLQGHEEGKRERFTLPVPFGPSLPPQCGKRCSPPAEGG